MSNIDIHGLLSQMRASASLARGEAATAVEGTAAPANHFSQLLQHASGMVDQSQQHSIDQMGNFEKGTPGLDLPDVMVSVQKANISFQAMTQVRNKLVSAYQEVMGMQI